MMNLYRSVSILALVALLSGCSGIGGSSVEEPNNDITAVPEETGDLASALTREQREAELQEQGLAELMEAEERLRSARIDEQRAEQQREERRKEEELRREQERQDRLERERQLAQNVEVQQSSESESAVQRAEKTALETQIEENNAAVARLEFSNDALEQAISAAGELSVVLNTEGQKYSDINVETGLTTEELSKEQIATLMAQVKRLREQASRLSAQTLD